MERHNHGSWRPLENLRFVSMKHASAKRANALKTATIGGNDIASWWIGLGLFGVVSSSSYSIICVVVLSLNQLPPVCR